MRKKLCSGRVSPPCQIGAAVSFMPDDKKESENFVFACNNKAIALQSKTACDNELGGLQNTRGVR